MAVIFVFDHIGATNGASFPLSSATFRFTHTFWTILFNPTFHVCRTGYAVTAI